MFSRRTILSFAGTVGVASLAGCSGESDSDENGTGDENGDGNGNGDNGDGNGNGDNGDNGDENGNGDNGDNGNDIEFRQPESYVVETEADGTTIVTEIDGENSRITYEGMEGETTTVDGVTYDVYAGGCYIVPEDESEAPDSSEVEMDAEMLEREGTETVDGQEMAVFTASHPVEGEVTYYVDPETGYAHRMESESGTTEFHSFGEVDPIEPPDMECQELPDGI